MNQSPEQRFSNRVENYVRYRPSYPAELVHLLEREARLGPESMIADIGSGTGISAELFLKAGHQVTGVEPNQAMREAAESLLAAYPKFRSVDGTAQATTLADGSIDLVMAAQAFHWFDTPEARAEFRRILKPGGKIALIWNERHLDTTPFLRGYEALLRHFGTDYAAIRHENVGKESLQLLFPGGYTTHSFPNSQAFDLEGLKGRLLSSSYTPAPGHPDHERMLDELVRLFDECQEDGKVSIDYDARVHLGG
ncbi:class I SAM-dependent methyltransferase [Luteolibacter flavescens]|uniref:Class I SAM-dependent methyltransferase n=1 Tax=Luteolibacter flavescens TaxID=1859460 RepID=A0ABT3FJX5_9BACT|nr:class I SAM-dependent methyltransferase [Luteolibacter flavescens]MCW1883596.1 class I SAM-dependent methyltransferase [Luteolibacter flavescens]